MDQEGHRVEVYPPNRPKPVAPFSPVITILIILLSFGVVSARVAVNPPGLSPPDVPFSPAIKAGNQIFISGQLGINPKTSRIVEGGIIEEMKAIFAALDQILSAAGASIKDVCKVTVLMRNLDEFNIMNQVYEIEMKDRLGDTPFPARTTFQAGKLPKDASVEIDAIAVI